MNARAALLLVALALFAAVSAILWSGSDEDHDTVGAENRAAADPTDGGTETGHRATPSVDPPATERAPVEPEGAATADVETGPTWADLVAPVDDRSGSSIESFQLEALTAHDAEVERYAADAPLDEALLASEALVRVVAPGFAPRVFVTQDLAREERPIAIPMRATTDVLVDVVGNVPEERPDVRLVAMTRSLRGSALGADASTWFEMDTATRAREVDVGDWSMVLFVDRSGTWLDPTSADVLASFESQITLAADEPLAAVFLENVPVGVTLIAGVHPAGGVPPVDVVLLREDGSIETMPGGTTREVRADGTTTITVQFGGTATLRWSFDGLVGYSAGGFKLFDESGRVTVLGARQERRHARMAAAGESYDPSQETRTEFTARGIPPGRYTFFASWMPTRDASVSCERSVTLAADQVLDLGDLESAPMYALELLPRLVVGPGVPDEIVDLVRAELVWTAGASPMDDRRVPFGPSTTMRTEQVGLNDPVVLEGLARGSYLAGVQVREREGPDLGDGFVVMPTLVSECAIENDTTHEVRFVLSATQEAVVEVTNASPGRARVVAMAFLEGPGEQDPSIFLPLESPRGARVGDDGRVALRGPLAAGAWRIVVVESPSGDEEDESYRVATTRVVVGGGPPDPSEVELVEAVTLVVRTDGSSSGITEKLMASPQAATAPTGWPPLGALLFGLERRPQDELRSLTLLPHTEYTLFADGSTFLTGAPGSTVELVR